MRHRLALLSILLVGAFLLGWDLARRSLWWDEIIIVLINREPVSSIFGSLQGRPGLYHDLGHPPVYHLWMHLWLSLGGQSDLAARLPGAVLGLLSLSLVYQLGRAFSDRRVGLLAAFLTALSPTYILYARMVRYYSLTTFLALACTWAFLRLMEKPERGRFLVYTAMASLLPYTEYLLFFLLLAQNAIAIGRFRRERGLLWRWFGVQGFVALTFLCWLGTWTSQTSRLGEWRPADLAGSPLGYLLKLGLPYLSYTSGETLFPWEPAALGGYILFAILLLLGMLHFKERGKLYLASLLAFLLVPLLGTVLVISIFTPTIPFIAVPNRAVFVLPFLYLLAAGGILRLRRLGLQLAALVLIAAIWGQGLANYFAGRHFFNPVYAVSAREMLEFVSSQAQAGDAAYSLEDTGFEYYFRQGNYPFSYYDLASVSLAEPPAARRVWLVLFGRDRTRLTDPSAEFSAGLERAGYKLVLQKGYVEQDPRYQRLKERLLGRPDYRYKAEVRLYAKF